MDHGMGEDMHPKLTPQQKGLADILRLYGYSEEDAHEFIAVGGTLGDILCMAEKPDRQKHSQEAYLRFFGIQPFDLNDEGEPGWFLEEKSMLVPAVLAGVTAGNLAIGIPRQLDEGSVTAKIAADISEEILKGASLRFVVPNIFDRYFLKKDGTPHVTARIYATRAFWQKIGLLPIL